MIKEKKNKALAEQNKLLKEELRSLKKEYKLLTTKNKSEKIRIQKFCRSLILKQEEDRKEISRELHDEIGQILTGINYELEILSKEASRNQKNIRDKIINAQHMIIDSVDIIHRFARDLRPMVLDNLGLAAALQSYIKEVHKRTETAIRLNSQLKGLKLDDFSKTTLFRIAQEALSNIVKHAKAKNASINLKVVKDSLVMLIHDDGVSFSSTRSKSSRSKRGLGLLGMQDRVKMLEGKLSIRSSPKVGTYVEIKVPLINFKNSK